MRRRTALAVALTLAISTGPAYAASRPAACTAVRLATIQHWAAAAVTRRETTIAALSSRLAARPHVTDAHRATLSTLFADDASGLRALRAKVRADRTCAAAHADATLIVTRYRVYVLLVPQAHLTVAADTGLYGVARLALAAPKAAKAIGALPAGETKTAAQAAYDDLLAETAEARRRLAGVGDKVLALLPSNYPGVITTLDAARSDVRAGIAALGKAVADAERLAVLLR